MNNCECNEKGYDSKHCANLDVCSDWLNGAFPAEGKTMKDVNGKDFEPCPGEKRKGPAALRQEARRLRLRADLLDALADQTDGTLSEEADAMLFVLANSKAV